MNMLRLTLVNWIELELKFKTTIVNYISWEVKLHTTKVTKGN